MKLILLFTILTGCVQKEFVKTITFKVDMSGIENINNVGVRGNFNNWSDTILFTDDDKDGIFEGIFTYKTASKFIEFKFVNQNEKYELNGKDNRIVFLKKQPEVIIYESTYNSQNFNINRVE